MAAAVIDLSVDLAGLKKLGGVLVAAMLAWWNGEAGTWLMWFGLAFFAAQSHHNYGLARKYKKIASQMRTAVNNKLEPW